MAVRPHPPAGSEQHQHLDCDDRDECLMTAARERWTGFDCRRCPKADGVEMFVVRFARPIPPPPPPDEPEKLDADAMAVLAALVKAEHARGGPACSRAVGAFLGIGGKGTALLLTSLEHRGMVRRVTQHNGSAANLWSLK